MITPPPLLRYTYTGGDFHQRYSSPRIIRGPDETTTTTTTSTTTTSSMPYIPPSINYANVLLDFTIYLMTRAEVTEIAKRVEYFLSGGIPGRVELSWLMNTIVTPSFYTDVFSAGGGLIERTPPREPNTNQI